MAKRMNLRRFVTLGSWSSAGEFSFLMVCETVEPPFHYMYARRIKWEAWLAITPEEMLIPVFLM